MITNPPIKDITLTNLGRFVQTWVLWFQGVQNTVNAMRTSNGGIVPIAMPDADAENNTIYLSTTNGKLSYKDSFGVVNALY